MFMTTRTLIVGGGIGGLATALVLSRAGFDVDLVESQARVETLGSGITLIGPALRALDDLGVLDDCLTQGFGITEFQLRNLGGEALGTLLLHPARPGLPGMMGMQRRHLHRILEWAAAAGSSARTGLSPTAITTDGDFAHVTFSDGSSGDYDLVVGADGLRSTVRALVFGSIAPAFRHQVCIRAILPRLAVIDQATQFMGHPRNIVGFTPTGPDSMYLYCCVPSADTARPAQARLPGILRELLAPFGGPVADACQHITDHTQLNYALLETIVVPEPWYRGRVVLLGDAAHATTPHLAAGGAMCLEDALVLGAELAKGATIPDGLCAYSKRRFDRCKYVVDTSAQLSTWQLESDNTDDKQQRLFGEAIIVLAEPY
jgi:2-polyprenyl-6-methoxyphenol hydroxylase-like FAD-dependent oxidoreductase